MGTEREILALAADAINGSEREIFSDALGANAEIEGDGDRSLETIRDELENTEDDGLDGEHDHEAQEVDGNQPKDNPGAKEPDKGAQSATQDQGQQPSRQESPAERGLRAELTSERDKRKASDNRASEMERQLAALQQQVATLSRQPAPQQPEPKQEPQKEEIPDRWTDPEGYDRWFENRILQKVQADGFARDQQRMAFSFEEAKAKHGDAFGEAFAAINGLPAGSPEGAQALAYVMRSPNPGEAVMALHRQAQARREIGTDPAAYRDRLTTETRESLMKDPEFRKQVLDAIQGEARRPANGTVPNKIDLPPSLNSARGNAIGRQFGGQSDADIFDQAFAR